MLIGYKRGQTSVVLRVKILDSSVTTGAGKTGLTFASSGLKIGTIADTESAATAYTAAGGTIETVTTLGTYAAPTATKCRFKEVDSTNHPGVYEIQLADARFAVSSAKSLLVSVSGATNAADCDVVIPLRDLDPYAATVDANLVLVDGVAGTTGLGQVSADVQLWRGSAPLTLASSQVICQVKSMQASTVTADALAADAAAEIADAVLTRQMTESYAADGVAPTVAQALFLVQQMLTEKGIVNTTLTVKKIDGSTTAAVFTLDSATAPTSITRAS